MRLFRSGVAAQLCVPADERPFVGPALKRLVRSNVHGVTAAAGFGRISAALEEVIVHAFGESYYLQVSGSFITTRMLTLMRLRIMQSNIDAAQDSSEPRFFRRALRARSNARPYRSEVSSPTKHPGGLMSVPWVLFFPGGRS